jgi:DNA-binding MarR family transcriptional regulator
MPWVIKQAENRSPFITLLMRKTRPLTPLEEVAAAKADLDGLAAEYLHYRRRYIKAIRKALPAYTQAEIAAHVGVSQATISKLLRKGNRGRPPSNVR